MVKLLSQLAPHTKLEDEQSMPCPDIIRQLVERYNNNRADYLAPQYKEFRLRKEFVDPFFDALGWDMANANNYAEAYKDVVHEDSLKIGTSSRAPDYAFRIGGTRKFFVETKVPVTNIKHDVGPAFQLRRYGWSAKLPLSILTDFEEFAVYDCRIKPDRHDKASVARIMYLRFDEYLERWDELAEIFSRDAILKGSFDRYADDAKLKRGTAEVDAAFLSEIERWRSSLARNIALRNPSLTVRQLNIAVQRTIDRIVFLRIAEDRGIEPYGRFQGLAAGVNVYQRLKDIFRQADARYNSGLFHFRPNDGSPETLDNFTLDLFIDDKVLREIFKGLYYPDSPYEFSVLPADILGQVYEQFLGKVIRLQGRSAIVEEKPEVKKSGGVYYTPTHIVRNIIKRTVGPLVANRTPMQIRGLDKRIKDASPIRIVDPACGSGSFLIEAYDFLLNWYRDWYVSDGAEKYTSGKEPVLYLAALDDYRLTISEKRQILLTHIYGVDIDVQAVEVTKLSLLLKLLEGESQDAVARQMNLFKSRVLPDLESNIKCGNSLVSDDLFRHISPSLFSDDDLYRVNAFNWNKAFGNRGFDVVIGNPPYDVLEKDRLKTSWPHEVLRKYVEASDHFQDALGGKTNLFRFFTVKSHDLLRAGGKFGMIMPMSLLADTSCLRTRDFTLNGAFDLEIDCFPQKDNKHRRVFRDAKLSTAVYVYRKGGPAPKVSLRVFPWNDFGDPYESLTVEPSKLALIDKSVRPIPVCSQESYDICLRLYENPHVVQLSDVTDIEIRRGEINQTIYKGFITQNPIHMRLLKGAEVGQYELYSTFNQSRPEWLNETEYRKAKYSNPLSTVRRIATQRITGVDDSHRLKATIIEPPCYFADSTNSIHLTVGSPYKLEYILALLNSSLFQWRFRLTSSNNNVGTNELEALPFRLIDFESHNDAKLYETIVDTASRLIKRKADFAAGRLEASSAIREISALNDILEDSIYTIYGVIDADRSHIERGALPRHKMIKAIPD